MAKDVDLFHVAMAGVAPLRGRSAARPAPSLALSRDRDAEKIKEPISPPLTPSKIKGGQGKDPELSFDRDIDRALARGRREPEATLDLHGLTMVVAERAVARFLEEAVSLDLKLVLIITGKGLRQLNGRLVEGRIRAEFPGWLQRADNRARVRGIKPAHSRHGGTGAFYVLLRRRQRK
jgi:DNA-nicking Smr family endonuclease